MPSGTFWATCNVGADTQEEYGDYFAWGETKLKEVFEGDTYKYWNGGYNQLTKYCNNASYGFNGFADDLTSLQEDDDVATTHWGEGWRIPTYAEWDELTVFCTQTWTTRNGAYGRLFTAPNGNSLFLPVAGYRSSSSFIFDGEQGFYWSSSLNVDDPNIAWVFSFHSDGFGMNRGFLRYYGLSIRPVHSANRFPAAVITDEKRKATLENSGILYLRKEWEGGFLIPVSLRISLFFNNPLRFP
ncbi:MAG: hypothetical protein IJ057_11985 [Bacteroidales bacterium]|nr:hypothetical protein [Bacteroidales bacterium]